MISSHEDAAFLDSSISLGADTFLFKPIRMSDIKGIWQFAVRKRHNTARKVRLASLNSASLTMSAWHPRSDAPFH
jgi:PleD family two-component response regulator